MNPDLSEASATSSTPHTPDFQVGRIIFWIAIQLIALFVAMSRFRFWPHTGDLDRDALGILLTIQVGIAALLTPFIMRGMLQSIAVILIPLPFIQLAGTIAAVPSRNVVAAAVALIVWFTSLAMWSSVMRGSLRRACFVALAGAFTFGGAILLYVRTEFAAPVEASHKAFFGPIVATLTIADATSATDALRSAWLLLLVTLISGTIALSINFAMRERAR